MGRRKRSPDSPMRREAYKEGGRRNRKIFLNQGCPCGVEMEKEVQQVRFPHVLGVNGRHCFAFSSHQLSLLGWVLSGTLQSFSALRCPRCDILAWVIHQRYSPVFFWQLNSYKKPSYASVPTDCTYGIGNLFQEFITHFFSAPAGQQNVWCHTVCMTFSPCFNSCEALMFSAVFFLPIHIQVWQKNHCKSSNVWPGECEGAWENTSFAVCFQDYFL